MNHPDEAQLHDWVDGRLEADEAAGVADHLEACGRCRERVEALGGLAARLGDLPREIPPRQDLRPELPDGGGEGEAAAGGAADARPGAGGWLRAAAVAAALAGTATAVWLGLGRDGGPEASAPRPEVSAYAEAAGELAREIRRRKGELSPEAARALEASLASVDEAIRELERARASGRTGEELTRRLSARYRTKLEILRGAAAWLETS